MSLAKLPGKTVWNRRLRTREWVTTIPVILRDLAPSSGFDPQEVWKREQELEEEEERMTRSNADDNEKSSKKSKKNKVSKKDVIIANQKKTKDAEVLQYDMERISTMKKSGGAAALVDIRKKIKSPIAKLELLLEILSAAVKKKEKTLSFDVFWAIEANALYRDAKQEIAARKLSKKEKEKEKDKKSKGKDKEKEKLPEKSPEAELLSKHKTALKTVQEWRSEEDMIVTQLTVMSDRLPPLSPFTSDFRLDEWQKRVLRLIDAGKSVVISAPTSSGKTIISTYVATLGRMLDRAPTAPSERKPPPVTTADGDEEIEGDEEADTVELKDRVLFVVPTEPLVWQVAAHFARHILSGNVALVTDQMIYSPHRKVDEPPAVVVGTPKALESAMTKIRGRSSYFELDYKVDRSQMVGGFHHYGWVVYDEIHVLDGDDGEALQRLIRLMNCNFLALSATVGNGEELRSWMERVRGEQLKVEVVNAPRSTSDVVVNMNNGNNRPETPKEAVMRAELEDANRLVKYQGHEGRFLNIQRHIWTRKDDSDEFHLKLLHPLSAITIDFLKSDGFKSSSLPMTPLDSYKMWTDMQNHYPSEAIADLDPHAFFSNDESTRITLSQSKEYEDELKRRLEKLAVSHETETQKLLDAYTLEDMPPEFNVTDIVMHLKGQSMLPCLIFHLNVFELIGLFTSLLGGIEERQKATHPNYYLSLERKAAAKRAEQERIQGESKNKQDREEAERDGTIQDTIEVVDYTAPHPDFVMNPSGPISSKEFEDICKEVQQRDKFTGDFSKHALMRALRRGIGLYINDHHFTAYRVAIMRLAMQGKLGVVLSDSSLAYGVNMPFRTCVFCGEMGGKLDTLMAQQMAGRSGRRGLDTQGHLVYAGSRASFIRELMLARIPAITGREPRYHTQFLQEMLSKYSNPKRFFEDQMNQLGGMTLNDYITGRTDMPNFREVSIDTLMALRLVEECDRLSEEELNQARDEDRIDFMANATPSGYRPSTPRSNCASLWLMWELRENLADSIALGCMLPDLYDEFIHRKADTAGDDIAVQNAFLLFLLNTVDRVPYRGDLGEGYCEYSLMDHPFVVRRGLQERLREWNDRLAEVQRTIDETGACNKEWMKLKVPPGQPLDSTVFHCLVNPGHVATLPPMVKQFLKENFLSISKKLILMHNNLMRDTARYGKFEMLTRKTYKLVQYVSRDLIQDIVNFADVSAADTEKLKL